MAEAMVGFAGGLAAALIGFWFTQRAKVDADRDHALGLLIVLQHDVSRCIERFRAYLEDNVEAPAYRLPTATWQASFALLAGSGRVSAEEIQPLAAFFELASEMNYCLDEVADADLVSARGRSEVNRARLKAKRALKAQPDEQEPLAPRAEKAVAAAVARARISSFWRFY